MFKLCLIILTWTFTAVTGQVDLGDPHELLKTMVTTTESPSTSEFQCADGYRIPWLLTCEGTNHCNDGSDEDPAMCLPRTCPMGFPYKCVASGRCLSELWLCDGQNDCPDGADENQLACKLDPLLLLQRVMRKMDTHDDLREYFDFELSPIPLTFFDKLGYLRRSKKASLYSFYVPVSRHYNIFRENAHVVIDGGYILHNIVWPANATYRRVCETYAAEVKRRYGRKCTIVFDGYLTAGNNLRSPERRRRQQRKMARKKTECEELNDVGENTAAVVPQLLFLSNYKNKARLIEMLSKTLRETGFEVIQADDDADSVIVQTAVREAGRGRSVIVLGQDVDLIVLLIVFSSPGHQIMLHRPGTGRAANRSYFIRSLQARYEYMVPNLLFLHAISGCDSTSSVYQVPKLKHLETYYNHPELHTALLTFNDASAAPEDVLRAGEDYLLKVYGGGGAADGVPADGVIKSLNAYRFHVFSTELRRSPPVRVDMSRLPPTLDAAKQHIFRTYLQVQLWRGNRLNPLHWGWEEDGDMIRPTYTQKPYSRDAVLEFIGVACTKMYEQRCGRKTGGMRFALICNRCHRMNLQDKPFGDRTRDDVDDHGNRVVVANVNGLNGSTPPPNRL